jgi:glutamine amidotransferase
MIAIIDYGMGNLRSVQKAIEAVGSSAEITSDPGRVRAASRVVLPGVGAFADCKRGLAAVDGMVQALNETVKDKARPFFGICVGMQLMATHGREYETVDGLGWIDGVVEKIAPRDEGLKVPHMGWNTLKLQREHPVLDKLPLGEQGRHAYFVHSFHLNAANGGDVVARADYGGPVTAVVAKDTMFGTQFHPEKSQRLGLALIANFLKWKP